MKCTCPKCLANVEIDISTVPAIGRYSNCPECKKRIWIHKELFAGRAIRKRGDIYCAECGKVLNHTIACPGCRALYPDFFVVLPKKSVPKQINEIRLSFDWARVTSARPRHKRPSAVSPKPGVKMPKLLSAVAGVSALIVSAIFGGYFYYQTTLENEYSRNFVRALYAIKTGRDISHETGDKILSGINDSSQIYGLKISTEDATMLSKVKSSADTLMGRVKNPPRKYVKVNEKLVRLYNIYSEMNNFITSPPNSAESFRKSANKLENDFAEGVKDMKMDMPQKLTEKISIAKARYKNLRDI